MEKIAGKVTRFIINNSKHYESEYDLLKYGIQVGSEMLLCCIFSLFISALLGIVAESIIVGAILLFLRPFCGGLHLKRFSSCFILSNLVMLGVPLMTNRHCIPIIWNLVIIIGALLYIFLTYPVEISNRKLDAKEKIVFREKMRERVIVVLGVSIIACLLGASLYVQLISMTLITISLSMIMGRRSLRSVSFARK